LNVVFISDNVDFKDISDYFIKKSNKNFYIAYTDDSFELLNNLNEKEDYNTYITNEVKNNDNTLYKILDEECYFLPYLDSNLNNNGEIFYCQKYINVDDNISKINKLLNDNKINLNIKCNNDYVNIDVKKAMNKLNVYINENKCLNSTKIIKNQISLMLDEYNDFVNKYNLNKKISNYKINIMINEGGNNE
jgi:type IV secretory pathway VirJ component